MLVVNLILQEAGYLAILVPLGILGLVLFIRFYNHVFPTAQINFRVDRTQAEKLGEQYLEQMGIDVSGHNNTTIFCPDEKAVIYLLKAQGVSGADALMRREVPAWYWEVRWFKPLVKEEYKLDIEPTGKVKSFLNTLPEDAPGKGLGQEEAYAIACDFVARHGVNLSLWHLVGSSSEKLKIRSKYSFFWEKEECKIGGATMRLEVTMLGDRVVSFNKFLKVPDDFIDLLKRQRSRGKLLASGGFVVGIAGLVLSLIVITTAHDALQWKFALPLGILAGTLLILSQINHLPMLKAHYSTDMEMGTFLGLSFSETMVSAFILSMLLLITGTAGDFLLREVFPNIKPPSLVFKWDFLSSPGVFIPVFQGYLLAFVWAGYIVIFYLFAKRFCGAWMPPASPYTDTLSTKAPWLEPLSAGIIASLSEEFAFRLFAIPMLTKYLGSIPLAIFVSSIVWALAHSHYLVFPVYVRSIELSILGIGIGYAFLRFGILPIIVAHYILNAVVFTVPLLRAQNKGFLVLGLAIVILFPAILAIIPAIISLKT